MGRAEASAALAWMRFLRSAGLSRVHMSHVPVEGLWARCVVCFIYGVRVPLRRLCASRMCYRMNPRRTCDCHCASGLTDATQKDATEKGHRRVSSMSCAVETREDRLRL